MQKTSYEMRISALSSDVCSSDLSALVRCAHGRLGQHAPDLIGLLRPSILDRIPDLGLTLVVFGDGEGHELLQCHAVLRIDVVPHGRHGCEAQPLLRSEEHTSELPSLMRSSYAVFCLKKKIK